MRSIRRLVSVLVCCALVLSATPAAAATGTTTRVVLAGDSVADGRWQGGGATPADRLADRLWGADHTRMVTVTEGGMCLVATGCAGAPLVDRWASILAAGPTTVIVLAGTNDLGRGLSDDVLRTAYVQLVDQADAVGVRVLLCTIPPRAETQWTTYWWWGPQRETVNAWLRASHPADVVDVDAVLRRPDGWADPQWMRPGDPIHPSWIGTVRISDAVPLGRIQ